MLSRGCGRGCNYPFLTLKERDIETGLDYFINRYYSSTQGRFTSADEPFAGQDAEDPQTWNLYSYTSGNPLNRVDEDGRRWFYKCDGQNGCETQWVNPNDDGSYTSPGKGWNEFIPTKEQPNLILYSQDGTQAHYFGEKKDGSPSVRTLWTGKVEDSSWDIVALFIPGRISVNGILAGASALWGKHLAQRSAAATVDDILKGASKGKVATSRQFHKPGGFDQANRDFDALTRGSKVTQRGSVRTAELPDGTKINVRPHSTAGKPTLEVQPPKGQGSPIKVRYQ